MATRRLITAIRCGNIQDVKDSINSLNLSRLPQFKIQELLHEAIRTHSKEILKLLLINGAVANRKSCKYYISLLHLAAQEGDIEIVEMLLAQSSLMHINAKNQDGYTLLHLAIREMHIEVAKLLLNKGANVDMGDEDDETPLHIAAYYGLTEIVEMILDNEADINAKNKDGCTSLHLAVREKHIETAKLLLNEGANVDIEDDDDETPLHVAATYGLTEIVEMILDSGADINAKDIFGWTPLQLAIREMHIETAKLLLNKGANVNIKGCLIATPLHLAAEQNGTEIVEMLLDRGADINAEDKYSSTPLQCATRGYNANIHRLLSQHVIKMKIAGFYINDENLRLIDSNTNFCNVCVTEIQAMKNETVGGSSVSFYNILKKSSDELLMFLRDKSIVQVLESVDYKKRFPMYGCIIHKQFISGKKRKELLERGTNVFHSNVRRLPNHCTENILSYLSDEDIGALINACVAKRFHNNGSSVVKIGKRKRSDL